MSTRLRSMEEAIAVYAVPISVTGCHIWIGALGSDGYPLFAKQRVNRFVVERKIGEPLGKRLACHICHEPLCVNEEHLYAGTPLSNMQDAQRRGTFDNLHKARDEQWARMSFAEKSKRAANGVAGVRAYMASLTQEERSAIARRAALARWYG